MNLPAYHCDTAAAPAASRPLSPPQRLQTRSVVLNENPQAGRQAVPRLILWLFIFDSPRAYLKAAASLRLLQTRYGGGRGDRLPDGPTDELGEVSKGGCGGRGGGDTVSRERSTPFSQLMRHEVVTLLSGNRSLSSFSSSKLQHWARNPPECVRGASLSPALQNYQITCMVGLSS